MKNSFLAFIENKPLFYKEIDHKRVHNAYALLKPHIQQPLTIHVVGTNGKGSTGRIMASLLHLSGIEVGHFSSPHIVKFNERIWINGEDISDEALALAHEKLYAILGQEVSEALSYFEYTTLLALVAMEKLEVMVLEAGLGGEFDATNVCSKALSVITPIGIDHQAFLGESIEEIATTKMNSIEKAFVLALQFEKKVYEIAQKIAQEKKAQCYRVEHFKKRYPQEYDEVKRVTSQLGWSEYLFENSLSALLALKKLHLPYNVEDVKQVKLFGRFYPLLPNVTIDVGHNLLAAKAIVKALQQKEKKPILVYNSLEDKDYVTILKTFKPHIQRVEIIELEISRALELKALKETLNALDIPYRIFDEIDRAKEYLVFGSFYVVEKFLKMRSKREV
jgi:dihydrofolate synthase/folylpolyglutamate synthase